MVYLIKLIKTIIEEIELDSYLRVHEHKIESTFKKVSDIISIMWYLRTTVIVAIQSVDGQKWERKNDPIWFSTLTCLLFSLQVN